MVACHMCGIPADAGFFDHSRVVKAPERGEPAVLASHELHRNACGMLMYFAQFAAGHDSQTGGIRTPGYTWEIRLDGRPLSPYLGFEHIVNPWGMAGFPLHVRLDGGSRIDMVIRNVDVEPKDKRRLTFVGGRIVGRYWYNPVYGDHRDAL